MNWGSGGLDCRKLLVYDNEKCDGDPKQTADRHEHDFGACWSANDGLFAGMKGVYCQQW